MNESNLAQRVLLKTSVSYAQRRADAIIYSFVRDMWAHPDVYRAAIQTAPVAQRAKLTRHLDLYLQCAHIDIHNPPADLENEMIALGNSTDTTLLVEVYFRDKPALDKEFLAAVDTLEKAGKIQINRT